MPADHISRKQLLQGCAKPGPDDGLDPRHAWPKQTPPAAVGRKTLQLCAQVYRAIEMALSGHPEDIFRDLMVASVVPARGKGCLFVTLVPAPCAPERPPEQWLEALKRLAPQAHFVVAQAIHRRKLPNLIFHWAQSA
ncbi:MAG: hypothetical protein SNJ75_02060 [Gemmataceae bacterium]